MANFFKVKIKEKTFNQQLTVSVEKLDINGVGVGRWQNKPIFIAGALPNEVVEAKVIEQKSKYARAKLISIAKQSKNRVEPQCQHFGVCGGCDLQMLSIDEQLIFKQIKVGDLFSRVFSVQGITKKFDILNSKILNSTMYIKCFQRII